MKIGEFLQIHMSEKKITQAELARRSGVPASTISSIIARNNDRVAIESMLKLCKVLECDIEEYINSLKGKDVKHLPQSFERKYYALDKYGRELVDLVLDHEHQRCISETPRAKVIEISFAELKVSAGTGEFLSDETTSVITIPDTPLNRRADYVVQVSGDSMEPMYHDEDMLLVEKRETIKKNEIGIFVLNGNGYVKQYGGDRLISLNENYDDIMLHEYDRIDCFGRVLGKVERG